MTNGWKWALGLTAVGAIALIATTAAAATSEPDKDDEDKRPDPNEFNETGVRHGVRFEGCRHFEPIDEAEIRSWALSNTFSLGRWLTRMSEIKENPEPFLVEAAELLFPECPWPPAPEATFGPNRVPWATAVQQAKAGIASFDSSAAATSSAEGSPELLALVFGLAFGKKLPAGAARP